MPSDRLSRFRRISENAFGILSARFRIINSTINLSPSKTTSLVMAIVALHNMLMTKSKDSYAPVCLVDQEDLLTNRIVPGQWRGMADVSNDLQTCAQRKASSNAKEIRDVFKDYFMGSGILAMEYACIIIIKSLQKTHKFVLIQQNRFLYKIYTISES